jgi:hypothetical protein
LVTAPPPRCSWRICAIAGNPLPSTRHCCTWIRFSKAFVGLHGIFRPYCLEFRSHGPLIVGWLCISAPLGFLAPCAAGEDIAKNPRASNCTALRNVTDRSNPIDLVTLTVASVGDNC